MTTAIAIRNSRVPLTIEQVKAAAPSAFATQPYEKMSARYKYIPTSDVINGMIEAGFKPFAASQSTARVDGKQAFTKHMIRFRTEHSLTKLGDMFPEVVLTNSHDGSGKYTLMGGIFVLVCLNGAIMSEGTIASVSIRHSGRAVEEVARGSQQLVEHMPKAIDVISRWREMQLSPAEQNQFALQAHAVRFAPDSIIQPAQLLLPRREADNKPDLWSVFNRVQENVIKGGLTAARTETHRAVTTREVRDINADVKFNRAMWSIGEELAASRN
jgi:hypothetical protein